MESIRVYHSDVFGDVRTTGTPDHPLFSANDVAGVLGYANPRKAVSDHCKGVTKRDTPTDGGLQSISYIPESDVYRLVMRSKLPQAEQFQDWVVEEILPSIRKSGSYTNPNLAGFRVPQTYSEALRQLADNVERNELLMIQNMEKEAIIKDQEPRVLFAKAVETSETSVLVADLAKILCQNGVNIGQNRLFKALRQQGYLGSTGLHFNRPTQRSMEMGLFEIKETSITKASGSVLVNVTPKVTGKGQTYFINKFLKTL